MARIKLKDCGDGWVGIEHEGRVYKVTYRLVDDDIWGMRVVLKSCNPKLIDAYGRAAIKDVIYGLEA